jgi:hypothetical protein
MGQHQMLNLILNMFMGLGATIQEIIFATLQTANLHTTVQVSELYWTKRQTYSNTL